MLTFAAAGKTRTSPPTWEKSRLKVNPGPIIHPFTLLEHARPRPEPSKNGVDRDGDSEVSDADTEDAKIAVQGDEGAVEAGDDSFQPDDAAAEGGTKTLTPQELGVILADETAALWDLLSDSSDDEDGL